MHVYIMCCTFVLFCFDYRDQVGVGEGMGGGWRRGGGGGGKGSMRRGGRGRAFWAFYPSCMYNTYGVTF